MNIQLVVFDMAGTTVRDDDAVNICLREALDPHVGASLKELPDLVLGSPSLAASPS